MLPKKTYILGDAYLKTADFKAQDFHNLEIKMLPYNYPTESLDFLGEAHLVFINLEIGKEDDCLRKIYALRSHFTQVPIILIAEEKQLSITQVVQSWRDGVTDCLIYPFGNDELSTFVNTYIEPVEQKKPLSAFFSFFNISQEVGFLPSAFRPSPPLSINEVETDLYVHFFGVLRLTNKGKALKSLTGTRLKSLFAYLLFHKKMSIHRDKLQRRFWHDFSTDSGRNNLNVTMTHLRRHFQQVFKEEIIVFQNDCFSINPNLTVQTDVHYFLEYFEQAKQSERTASVERTVKYYKQAIDSYKSDFLEDLWHEEWAIPIRDDLQEKYITALSYVSNYHMEHQQFEQAIESLRQILSKDNCWEEAHRKLMICYTECGKIERAIRQFQECERVLNEKLEVAPSKTTVELFKKLKANLN